MATTHTAQSTYRGPSTEQDQDKPILPTLTDPSLLLPQKDSSINRASLQSFLSTSTDPDPSTPSPGAVISPTLSDSVDLSATPKSFLMPFRPKPTPPPLSNPIRYTSYEHGAPLSDIGEEETTPRSKIARSRTPSPSASSPTLPPLQSTRWNRRAEKRLSEMSNSSNVSSGSDMAWETFDTKAGMSDRLKADLAAMEDDSESGANRISTGPVGDDELTSQALSKKAEQILASAKKRLTNMEDNLSKARTSFLTSPKSSPTFGEHKQAGGLYRSISQGGDRRTPQGTTNRKNRHYNPSPQGGSTNHTRNQSDTSLPSKSTRHHKHPEVRSASAMDLGYGSASIDRVLYDGPDAHSPALIPSPNNLAISREETDDPPTIRPGDGGQGRGLGIRSHSAHSRHDSNESSQRLTRSQSQMSTRELRDQMNGLKTRIEDLRSGQHADQLKRNSFQNSHTPSPFTNAEDWYTAAREYSGESPLSTNAGKGWRTSAGEDQQVGTSPVLPSYGPRSPPRSPESHRLPTLVKDFTVDDVDEPPAEIPQEAHSSPKSPDSSLLKPAGRAQSEQDSYIHDSHYEDASSRRSDQGEEAVAASEEEQIFLNEVLEESLQNPDDEPVPDIAPQNLEPERHEDRADAFDYQNFFLHSALGNYSQTALKRRNGKQPSDEARMSYASTASVETMRGTQAQTNGILSESDESLEQTKTDLGTFLDDEVPKRRSSRKHKAHLRSNSMESDSSADTFATATEGGEKGDRHSGDSDTIPTEILNWGGVPSPSYNLVGAWPSPPATIPRSNPFHHPTSRSLSALASAENLALDVPSSLPTPPTSSPLHHDHDSSSSHSDNETETETSSNPGSAPSNSSRRQGQPPNTEILISALITLANPEYKSSLSEGPGGFAEIDKDLVVNVLRSVGGVCEGINSTTADAGGALVVNGSGSAAYERKIWRRRLDVARRVLEGEIEIEEEYNAVDILK